MDRLINQENTVWYAMRLHHICLRRRNKAMATVTVTKHGVSKR
jgi:hypothetical protein